MSYTSDYLNVHDDSSRLIPFLSKVQQEIHVLESSQLESLTSYLLADLDSKAQKEWDEQVTTQALLTLKHLGRRVDDCDMLYKKQGFHILIKWTGLLESSQLVDTSASREALKCLANCILLSGDAMKTWLVESKNALCTCVRLLSSDSVSVDIQFLICRLLYLMTCGDGPSIIDTLMELDLATVLAKILTKQVDGWLQEPLTYSSLIPPYTQQPAMLVCEVFQLQRNVMIGLQETKPTSEDSTDSLTIKEEVAERFTASLTPILDILYILPRPTPFPLVPASVVTNALFVLNLYTYNLVRLAWYASPRLLPYCTSGREKAMNFCIQTLLGVLQDTLVYLMPPISSTNARPTSGLFLPSLSYQTNADEELDRAMALIISYLISTLALIEEAGLHHSIVLTDAPLFPRLVKLLSSTRFTQVREMVGELLYGYVNEDANALIALVGYDHAKQILLAKEGAVPDPPPHCLDTPAEELFQPAEMSKEEKEQEAERLFVMFERVQLQD